MNKCTILKTIYDPLSTIYFYIEVNFWKCKIQFQKSYHWRGSFTKAWSAIVFRERELTDDSMDTVGVKQGLWNQFFYDFFAWPST